MVDSHSSLHHIPAIDSIKFIRHIGCNNGAALRVSNLVAICAYIIYVHNRRIATVGCSIRQGESAVFQEGAFVIDGALDDQFHAGVHRQRSILRNYKGYV